MTQFVMAFEFSGADLPPRLGAARRPVRAHAYDVDTGTFAHQHDRLRVGFPEPCQGWNTASTLPHCARCSDAVTNLVSTRIRVAVTEAAACASTHPMAVRRATDPALRPGPTPHLAGTAHHPTVRRHDE